MCSFWMVVATPRRVSPQWTNRSWFQFGSVDITWPSFRPGVAVQSCVGPLCWFIIGTGTTELPSYAELRFSTKQGEQWKWIWFCWALIFWGQSRVSKHKACSNHHLSPRVSWLVISGNYVSLPRSIMVECTSRAIIPPDYFSRPFPDAGIMWNPLQITPTKITSA